MTGIPGQGLSAAERVRRAAVTLAALSQGGLEYGVGEYDRDRYRKVGAVAADLLAAVTDRSAEDWRLELGRDSGYATPKVDVRGALVDGDERILLMRERSDERWSLPGGWADPLDPPSRAAEREIREETGYVARRSSWSGAGTATCRATRHRCRCTSTSCSSCASRRAPPESPTRSRRWRSAGSVFRTCRNSLRGGSPRGNSSG